MATVSSKEMKNRIRSMESTRQITKAMEMVATSKLRRAQAQALSSRPYFETLYGCIQDILSQNQDRDSAYLKSRPVKKSLYVMIAGDRGLAGGYNSNVLKMVGKDAAVLPIGRKAVEYFHNAESFHGAYGNAEDINAEDCFTIAKLLCKAYLAEEIDEIILAYTRFHSVLSQSPSTIQLLPVQAEGNPQHTLEYEPDPETVLNAIIPQYLGGMLFGALVESRASEQGARRTAMNAATQNAEEMIESLREQFNRARQAAITQEITEIVAGF